jgi:hypothetical protein
VSEQPWPVIDDEPERSNVQGKDGDVLGPSTDPGTGLRRAQHLDDSDEGSDDRKQSNCGNDGHCNQHGDMSRAFAMSEKCGES